MVSAGYSLKKSQPNASVALIRFDGSKIRNLERRSSIEGEAYGTAHDKDFGGSYRIYHVNALASSKSFLIYVPVEN